MDMLENKKKNTLTVLLVNIIFSVLLTRSIDFSCSFYAERIIVIGMFYLILLVVLPSLTYWNLTFGGWVDRKLKAAESALKWCRNHPYRVLKIAAIYVAVIIVSVAAGHLYSSVKHQEYNPILSALAIGILYLFVTCYLMRKVSGKHPEYLFFALVAGLGTLVILSSPINIGISWDDQIHYEKAEVIPDIITGKRAAVDEKVIHSFGPYLDDFNFSKENRIRAKEEYNSLYRSGQTAGKSGEIIGVGTIAFLPYDAAIIAGRGLGLPFTVIFRLAKIVNLLTYATIVVAAAKKLKAGRVLMLMIGMMPTAWFMATNYSYDPWVIGWTMYGFCYFVSFLQDKERKINGYDMLLMIGASVIGCLPKAVYLVLMFPLFFMPSRVFKNKKQHIFYVLMLFLGGFLLLGTFALPMLVKGAGTGDARGGSDVNATEQIRLILSNPVWYAGMLSRYIVQFINPVYAKEYLQNYDFYGILNFGKITFGLYLIVAVFDKNGEKSKRWFDVPISIFTFLICMVLVASALYITFTPVGLDTVNGCQRRYIIPALATLLYMIVPDRIRNPFKPELFVNIPMMFLAGSFVTYILYSLTILY